MSHGDPSVVQGNGSVRTRLALLAGLFATVLATALAVPGPAQAASSGHMTHPELDWLGSQIKIHEGVDASGDSKVASATATCASGSFAVRLPMNILSFA